MSIIHPNTYLELIIVDVFLDIIVKGHDTSGEADGVNLLEQHICIVFFLIIDHSNKVIYTKRILTDVFGTAIHILDYAMGVKLSASKVDNVARRLIHRQNRLVDETIGINKFTRHDRLVGLEPAVGREHEVRVDAREHVIVRNWNSGKQNK
jgi:hypothetical protein